VTAAAGTETALTAPCAAFWRACCEAHGIDPAGRVDALYFASPEIGDELAALVCIGRKRASAGLARDYEEGGELAPVVGGHLIVTSVAGVPLALVRTVRLDTWAFRDVPAWFAEREGEDEGVGDACLASWKAGHGAYFARACVAQDRAFEQTERVVCESFDIVHVRPDWREHLNRPG
jgi:uncharacterized protein YhfF